jgi:hypothetical protein
MMKTDINMGGTKLGLGGFTGLTPKWASATSNYLLIATVLLFVLSGFVEDWAWMIPDTKLPLIEQVISSVEKSMVTIATMLRFLGVNKSTGDATKEG